MAVLPALLGRERAILIVALVALFVLAALYTVFGFGMSMSALEMTAMRHMRDMPGGAPPGEWSLAYATLVFLMWWVMMVAMMLPSVAPIVLLYAALLRRTREARAANARAAVFLLGYLLAWAGFALLAALVQNRLEGAGLVSPTMMTLIDTVPGGIVLLLAGVYQFLPLKQSCLSHCRSPIAFLTLYRREGTLGALRMGLGHGSYCLGCCFALMALLFVGGIMNLYWILALTLLVALEKLTPFGAWLARIVGAGLILMGLRTLWLAL